MILLCSSQREGSCMAEDDAADIEHENSNRFEEYEWCGQKRIPPLSWKVVSEVQAANT